MCSVNSELPIIIPMKKNNNEPLGKTPLTLWLEALVGKKIIYAIYKNISKILHKILVCCTTQPR